MKLKHSFRFGVCLFLCSISFSAIGQIPMPKNASPALGGGLGWLCNPSYEHVGFTCQKIELPDNARYFGLGNYWRCTRGYRKVENQCLRVPVPSNASLNVIGNDWVCVEGFKQVIFGCIPEKS